MRSSKMLSVLVAGSILTVACGDSKSSINPVAPSAVVIGADHDEASDGGAQSSATGGKPANPGNGNGGDNGEDKDKDKGKDKGKDQPTAPTPPGNVTPPTNTTPPAPTTRKVEIEGPIAAKGGDSITVNGQIVVVPPTCPIRHGSTSFLLVDLHVGDRVHVRASRTTTGTGATAATTLEATDVKLQNPGGVDDDDPVDPTALVSVTAFDALASEAAGNTGAFRLTRSGSATLLALPLTVTFALSGTATNGADYQNLPVTATFLASHATVDVLVTPLVDTTTEGSESVTLTLTGVTPYDLGSPATATVTITDTDTPLVSVTAFDSTASETGPDLGTFRFSRTGSTAAALTVTFTVTGTAISGTDYQSLPLTVTFGAGQATADLFVVPLPDAMVEGPETVIVTVTDAAAYDLGSPVTATITITG
ncbi:MAG: Calx-beta domain-containing protein [Vicinamibacterales bacterium]